MAIVGVGTDVVEIDRFAAALQRRPRLAERCFTPAEAAYCLSRRFPPQHFAAPAPRASPSTGATGRGPSSSESSGSMSR